MNHNVNDFGDRGLPMGVTTHRWRTTGLEGQCKEQFLPRAVCRLVREADRPPGNRGRGPVLPKALRKKAGLCSALWVCHESQSGKCLLSTGVTKLVEGGQGAAGERARECISFQFRL